MVTPLMLFLCLPFVAPACATFLVLKPWIDAARRAEPCR